ncbi:glycosyltransferase family 4 protein, partial [Escherichia coli]|nr:glycosyltransferase family 4 protein [Escherichia coli]
TIPGVVIKRSKMFSGLLWQQFILPIQLFFLGKPIITSLSGLGPILYPNKLLAIHDASLYRYPSYFSNLYRIVYKKLYPITIFFSKAIITVSEFSKQEIKELINISKDILVVNNVTPQSYEGSLRDNIYEQMEPYILVVGTLDKRKNLKNVLEAFQQSKLKGVYKLLVAGGTAKSFSDNEWITNLCSDDVIFLGYVSDAELANLYNRAHFFIYMSIYEGFGIPPLESLANNCPVLLSDIDVFKEIYGDSFEYANPLSVESIAMGLERVVSSDRHELYEKQRIALSKYTKENQVKQFEEIIKRYIHAAY